MHTPKRSSISISSLRLVSRVSPRSFAWWLINQKVNIHAFQEVDIHAFQEVDFEEIRIPQRPNLREFISEKLMMLNKDIFTRNIGFIRAIDLRSLKFDIRLMKWHYFNYCWWRRCTCSTVHTSESRSRSRAWYVSYCRKNSASDCIGSVFFFKYSQSFVICSMVRLSFLKVCLISAPWAPKGTGMYGGAFSFFWNLNVSYATKKDSWWQKIIPRQISQGFLFQDLQTRLHIFVNFRRIEKAR